MWGGMGRDGALHRRARAEEALDLAAVQVNAAHPVHPHRLREKQQNRGGHKKEICRPEVPLPPVVVASIIFATSAAEMGTRDRS